VIQFFILKSGLIFENQKAHARRSERCQREMEISLKKRERKDRANIAKGVNRLFEKAESTASTVEAMVHQLREVQEQQSRAQYSPYNLIRGKVHPDLEYEYDEEGSIQTPILRLAAAPSMSSPSSPALAPVSAALSPLSRPSELVLSPSADTIEGPSVALMLMGSSSAVGQELPVELASMPVPPATDGVDQILHQMMQQQQQHQQQMQMQLVAHQQQQTAWQQQQQAQQQQQQAQQEVMQTLLEEVRALRQQR
jgi:hypothetical protein